MQVILNLDKQQLEDFYIILKNTKIDYTNSIEMATTLGLVTKQIEEKYKSTLIFDDKGERK